MFAVRGGLLVSRGLYVGHAVRVRVRVAALSGGIGGCAGGGARQLQLPGRRQHDGVCAASVSGGVVVSGRASDCVHRGQVRQQHRAVGVRVVHGGRVRQRERSLRVRPVSCRRCVVCDGGDGVHSVQRWWLREQQWAFVVCVMPARILRRHERFAGMHRLS